MYKKVAAEVCALQKNIRRELVISFVSYRSGLAEIERLWQSLRVLPPNIGYAVYINEFCSGCHAEKLISGADLVITNRFNVGYGRAVNSMAAGLSIFPAYFAAANTDLYWNPGDIEKLLTWLGSHPDVSLSVPLILDEEFSIQKLCKRNPTLLALASRRFVPWSFKPQWLKHYDNWFAMHDKDYESVFDSEYLSGCFMVFRGDVFKLIGGFDERYFLYLEDADITRSASLCGRCVHLPVGSIVHRWGRGNHKSIRLSLINIVSAWKYFCKWGFALW